MTAEQPHIPVLIGPLIRAVSPVSGVWVDGTFGAGGYTREIIAAGADQVIGIDRDPTALAAAVDMQAEFGNKLRLHCSTFAEMGDAATQVDGVMLDLGVSSMQLDQAPRGFSFAKDGPLDMRMGDAGATAADIVNDSPEALLADILFNYGEERASRRIARAIVKRRDVTPFTRTLDLAEVIEGQLPRAKPGQSHPATRSFQALRIAVNNEYEEVARGLAAAEAILRPGGMLAVVSFHSLEDRIVKRFFQSRAGGGGGSRYAPEQVEEPAQFTQKIRKAIGADASELDQNPRARSALLRVGQRTDAPPRKFDLKELKVPVLPARSPR